MHNKKGIPPDKPILTLTVGELIELSEEFIEKFTDVLLKKQTNKKNKKAKNPPGMICLELPSEGSELIHGVSGLAAFLGMCRTTLKPLVDEGFFNDALCSAPLYKRHKIFIRHKVMEILLRRYDDLFDDNNNELPNCKIK